MANENLTEIKVLFQKLLIEVAIGEERLSNRVEKTEFLEKTQKIKDELNRAIREVDKRVTGLYIKVIALTLTMATAISVALRFLL